MKKNKIGIEILFFLIILSGCGKSMILHSNVTQIIQTQLDIRIEIGKNCELERKTEEEKITKTMNGILSEEPEDKDEEKLIGPKIDPNFGVIIQEQSEFILYQDVNDKFSFTCQIYSDNGKLVKQKTLDSLRVPTLELITDDIMLILTNAGTNLNFYTYYDRKNNIESETFMNVKADEGRLIAYMEKIGEKEEVCLIIRDIFDKEIYYKEIRRNFAPHICIDVMVNSVVFLDEDTIRFEYLDKDSGELITEMIEL